MALRDSKVFVVITSTMVALVILSFALRVYVKVSTGHGLGTYVSGKGIPWTYISAAISLGAIGLAAAAVLVVSTFRRLRDRKRVRGDA